MKLTRTFKENVLAVGFFLLSLAVFIILAMGVWGSRTSHRVAPPAENVQK